MMRFTSLRHAEQLALDKLADRVRRGDVDLLDQRGFLGRRREQRSHSASSAVCPSQVKPTVTRPSSRAALQRRNNVRRTARRRDRHEHVALAAERADLAREHLLEAVVVADRGQRRGVGGERDRGSGARSLTKRPTNSAAMCWASAALPPLPASRILPPLLSERGDPLGDGDDRGHEFAVCRGTLDDLAASGGDERRTAS